MKLTRTVVQVALSPEEKSTWQIAAKEAGVTLSEWARSTLNAKVGQTPNTPVKATTTPSARAAVLEQFLESQRPRRVAEDKPGPVANGFARRA